jgi:hypothetical protein
MGGAGVARPAAGGIRTNPLAKGREIAGTGDRYTEDIDSDDSKSSCPREALLDLLETIEVHQ